MHILCSLSISIILIVYSISIYFMPTVCSMSHDANVLRQSQLFSQAHLLPKVSPPIPILPGLPSDATYSENVMY